MKPRVLITGANGLLGHHLISELDQSGLYELVLTGKGPNRNTDLKWKYWPCDLQNEKQVADLLQKSEPQFIIHAGAMTQVDDCEANQEACWNSNVLGTSYLLQNCPAETYFLYVSTDFVFDGLKGLYCETDIPNPISHYGRSKLEAEKLVTDSPIHSAIVRTVLVYGIIPPGARSNIVWWVVNELKAKKTIRVVNDQWRTPTLVNDLATGCIKLLEKRASGIYHLSGAELITPYEFARIIASKFNLDQSLISPVDSTTFKQLGQRPLKTGFTIEKAKNEIDFRPKSLDQGLDYLVHSYEKGINQA